MRNITTKNNREGKGGSVATLCTSTWRMKYVERMSEKTSTSPLPLPPELNTNKCNYFRHWYWYINLDISILILAPVLPLLNNAWGFARQNIGRQERNVSLVVPFCENKFAAQSSHLFSLPKFILCTRWQVFAIAWNSTTGGRRYLVLEDHP